MASFSLSHMLHSSAREVVTEVNLTCAKHSNTMATLHWRRLSYGGKMFVYLHANIAVE